jgi:hypothetical protein
MVSDTEIGSRHPAFAKGGCPVAGYEVRRLHGKLCVGRRADNNLAIISVTGIVFIGV